MPTWSASTRRRLHAARRGRPRRPRRPGRAPRTVHGVEERVVRDLDARRRAARRPAPRRSRWVRGRDRAQPVGAVVDGVHRRRPRPAAPARCRCWRSPSRGGCAARGSAAPAGTPGGRRRRRETPTSRPGRCRSRPARDGHVAGVRAAEEQRHAEALGWSRRRRRRRARPATRAASARAGRRRPRPARRARAPASISRRGSRIRAGGARVLQQHAEQRRRRAARRRGRRRRPRCPSPRRGCATTSMVCGSASASTTNGPVALLVRAAHQRHRLGGRGALVEQRRVGGRQAGQVGDHGLEVEQRLEPALARSPAGTACRRCTRPGPRARCAGSPAGVIVP